MAEAVLVHGAERLAVRTAEQLRLLDVQVVELGDMDVAELEARLAQGGAEALVLCDEGDIVNFHLALAARELQPELRLVVRLFNLELGQQAERLLSCRALSASQLAAPAFVEAALRDDEGALRVLSRERAGDVEWVPGDDERLERDDVVTVVGTQIGLAQLAGR